MAKVLKAHEMTYVNCILEDTIASLVRDDLERGEGADSKMVAVDGRKSVNVCVCVVSLEGMKDERKIVETGHICQLHWRQNFGAKF